MPETFIPTVLPTFFTENIIVYNKNKKKVCIKSEVRFSGSLTWTRSLELHENPPQRHGRGKEREGNVKRKKEKQKHNRKGGGERKGKRRGK